MSELAVRSDPRTLRLTVLAVLAGSRLLTDVALVVLGAGLLAGSAQISFQLP